MIIERIQVEEGFLEGLDLRFTDGLNVLIGPRGSGKTSVIELVRFCLGARTLTEKAAQSTQSHAASILGPGKVTVTFKLNGVSVAVSRSAEHWIKPTTDFLPPLILAQNEIETVGMHSMGRLRLLDSVGAVSSSPANETSALALIRSRSEERRTLTADLQTIRGQIRQIREELQAAEALKKQHSEALASIEKAKAETERLGLLSGWLAAFSVRAGVYSRSEKSLVSWIERLKSDRNLSPSIEAWPSAAGGDDPLAAVRAAAAKSLEFFDLALQQAGEAHQKLRELIAINQNLTLTHEEEARGLRRRLESLQQGAGEIARRLAQLKEKEGQLGALVSLEATKQKALLAVQDDRKRTLDAVERIREERFVYRTNLAARLNSELSPRVRISVERAGQTDEYASSIIAALRGSGLKFNEVGPLIAENASPREFIELVESEDAEALADMTGISLSRAANIVGRINTYGVESILTSSVEDGVTISLLDGSDYKNTEEMSTGQRCTAVLPLLLHQNPLSLLVDQPEDHLDNAFVVETLIKMINLRKGQGQMIFSTHNPNIPVLGDADRVILLGSDGRRGFVRHAGALDEPETVRAITSVMEGGLEAFDRRSTFYHSTSKK